MDFKSAPVHLPTISIFIVDKNYSSPYHSSIGDVPGRDVMFNGPFPFGTRVQKEHAAPKENIGMFIRLKTWGLIASILVMGTPAMAQEITW